jgi:two-component system, cell cycle response regulator
MEPSTELEVRVLAVGGDPGDLSDGIDVELATDASSAIERLVDGGVDLLLVSTAGPEGASGIEALRSAEPDVPIVALVPEESAGAEALRLGAYDYVVLGAPVEVVRRAVRYAIKLHEMEGAIHRRQTTDEVTGLLNARGFEQLARHHLQLSDRSKEPVALVFFRLDDLETSTEEEGRQLLVDTAQVLAEAARDSDVLARVGDDAFCVLLTGGAEGAETLVLSRFVEAVAVRNARLEHLEPLKISVGAARYDPEHPSTLDELIAEADRRMREPGEL